MALVKEVSEQRYAVEGWIVHLRRVSRKLVFFDARLKGMHVIEMQCKPIRRTGASDSLEGGILCADHIEMPELGLTVLTAKVKVEFILKYPTCPDVKTQAADLRVGDLVQVGVTDVEMVCKEGRKYVLYHASSVDLISSVDRGHIAIERPMAEVNSVAGLREGCKSGCNDEGEHATKEIGAPLEKNKDFTHAKHENSTLNKLRDTLVICDSLERNHDYKKASQRAAEDSEGANGCMVQSTQALLANNTGGALPSDEASQSGKLLPVCKYWVNTGSCSSGIQCPFAHPCGNLLSAARKEWTANRILEKKMQVSSPQDPLDPHSKARKGMRASIFAEWLIQTFSRTLLQQGAGILDIAGGRGALSFALHTMRGLNTTLVDRRPRKLSRAEHKYLEANTTATLSPIICGEFVTGEPYWADLACRASCLVGLHPDEATEAILVAALTYKRPFAIVPCCVFPRTFPERRVVEEGVERPVETYSQFVEYLKTLGKLRGALVEVGWLNMEGKNLVIFCRDFS